MRQEQIARRFNAADWRDAYRRLSAERIADGEIARLFGLSPRTLWRWLARERSVKPAANGAASVAREGATA